MYNELLFVLETEKGMSIKAVLFDLDGTLLSMDQDHFIKTYLGGLAKHLAPYGYDPDKFARVLWKGTGAMVVNDGSKRNEEVFWDVFSSMYPERDLLGEEKYFDEFYETKFDDVRDIVSKYEPLSVQAVEHMKNKGLRVILATNPLFPSVATRKRIAWAGFSPEDFEFFTSYENSTYSKPSLGYYREVAERAGLRFEECLMVGNDVSDDMVAKELGMKVFLLTDHLINKDNEDISVYPNGGFAELMKYVDSL